MEVEVDTTEIESLLTHQFSVMGTEDRDVLVSQFQKLMGFELKPESCVFYLEMNNWNIQDAICSYCDYEQPATKLPSMTFLKDETIGEGESVPPDTIFIKTWRIQNTGQEQWPHGCFIKFVTGEKLCEQEKVVVDALLPCSITTVNMTLKSPMSTGIYQNQWRLCTPSGHFFGDIIWVIITVEESGLLGVTQQFNSIGQDCFSHGSPQQMSGDNPFSSPFKLYDIGQTSPASLSMVALHGSPPSSPHQLDASFSSSCTSTPSRARASLFNDDQTESCLTQADMDT